MFDISVGVASNAAAVMPNDDSDLDNIGVLYVGGAGDVSVLLDGQADNAPVTFVGVPAGSWLPVRVRRVRNTDTTATDILLVW